MTDPLEIWRQTLDPTPILANPHIPIASALMEVAVKLGAVRNMLSTLNDDHPEERKYGLDVANMAAAFALTILNHFGLVDDGPIPPVSNLKMAQCAIANLLAEVRGQLEAWQRAAHQEDDVEPEAVTPTRGSEVSPQGKIVVARWADVGIGIDDDWTYHAFIPCPEFGSRVKLKEATTILPLVGERWRKVLDCLARSGDGQTAHKSELAMELGYFKKGEVREDQAVFGDGLKEKGKNALATLKNTMADLARELRTYIKTTDTTIVFQSKDKTYQAAFVTRHLFRDPDGNIAFGRVE